MTDQSAKLDVSASSIVQMFDVREGQLPDDLTLLTPSGEIVIVLPATMLPKSSPGERVLVGLVFTRISLESDKPSAIIRPNLILPQ